MASPALRAVAVCLFFAAARPSHADPSGTPTALACPQPGAAGEKPDPPAFVRGCPPTPAQLKLLHDSVTEAAPGFRLLPKRALLISGVSLFAGVYSVSAALTGLGNGLACVFEHHRDGCGSERVLFIPVVGPLLHLARSEQPGAHVFGPILVIASLAQLTGLTLLAVGSAIPGQVPIAARERPGYSLVPYLSPGGGGLQALVRY